MSEGIKKALIEHAADEGKGSALTIAERWRDCLEEMAEVADKTSSRGPLGRRSEQSVISGLLKEVHEAIKELVA